MLKYILSCDWSTLDLNNSLLVYEQMTAEADTWTVIAKLETWKCLHMFMYHLYPPTLLFISNFRSKICVE